MVLFPSWRRFLGHEGSSPKGHLERMASPQRGLVVMCRWWWLLLEKWVSGALCIRQYFLVDGFLKFGQTCHLLANPLGA